MNWNPYTRIAELERRVEKMHNEVLHLTASISARLRMLETAKPVAKSVAKPVAKSVAKPMTLEEAKALANRRVRQNAYNRKYYAKRKAAEQAKAAEQV